MKFRILLNIIGPGLIWLTLLGINQFYPNFILHDWVLIGLFLGSLLRPVFIKKKYLTNLSLDHESLKIEYLTQFLQKKYFRIPSSQIMDIEYLKRNWLFEECSHISLKHDNEWIKFGLMGKQAKDEVKKVTADIERISSENHSQRHLSPRTLL